MLRHKKYVLQVLIFLLLLISCVSAVNRILIPKYFYNTDWATTSTYTDFYHMEKNSVDVLFLGSSHCVAAFSPMELYEKYGIRSYNLGCEQQNLLLSYYWLQEALRFQTPRYVFLDTFMLFPYDEAAPLNTSEATTRKAMDFMKWSFVKLRAVRDICAIDREQKFSGYLFPNERFHTRWKMLSEDDFRVASMAEHEAFMGFFPLDFVCNDDSYQPFREEGQVEYAEMVPVMKEYLDRIRELCALNDIELVLVKSPSKFYSQEAYYAVNMYAYENGLEYMDFNEESLYRDAGLEFAEDSCDTDHLSVSGAMKLTDYVGEWLLDKVSHGWEDQQWEKRVLYYKHHMKDGNLKNETDLVRYLQLIQDDNYSVFITVQEDASGIFGSAAAQGFSRLGLTLQETGEYGESYYAVIDSCKVLEEAVGKGVLEHQGTVRDGLVKYRIMSGGTEGGSASSIVLDGGEFSMSRPGLNIAVYCNDKKRLIDRVCFYVEQGEIRCSR